MTTTTGKTVRVGDSVTIKTRFGREISGRAVLVFATHAVLNHKGQPVVAWPAEIVRTRKAKGN